WRAGDGTYVVIEQSPDMTGDFHDRLRPGMNHLAVTIDGQPALDALVDSAGDHGWTLLFPDRHPFAGGAEHYAAYLEDAHGFEVEIVALD
ncbi:MAG: VOC family protein, partial [Rhodoglobus sp.]